MKKRLIWMIAAVVFFVCQLPNSAQAIELSEEIRTVKLNPEGEQVVLSLQELEQGKRIFYDSCSQCHLGGRTKTNPNVTLKASDLEGAYPPRDNIVALVDYLKYPMTYDGEEEITLFHPNTERSDIYSEMRNYNEDDLAAVSGYILVQPRVRESWGRGKVYD